mmetsp:Transcript_31183/g.100044  ORF Transcript_31183/g.100044 Transcript_31183/m.100044 type:complete len:394 (+) Transcript_31183:1935-3116(+)
MHQHTCVTQHAAGVFTFILLPQENRQATTKQQDTSFLQAGKRPEEQPMLHVPALPRQLLTLLRFVQLHPTSTDQPRVLPFEARPHGSQRDLPVPFAAHLDQVASLPRLPRAISFHHRLHSLPHHLRAQQLRVPRRQEEPSIADEAVQVVEERFLPAVEALPQSAANDVEADGQRDPRPDQLILTPQEGLSCLRPHEALEQARDPQPLSVGEGGGDARRGALFPDRHDLPGRNALKVVLLPLLLPLLAVPLHPQALPGAVGKVSRMEGLNPPHGPRVGSLHILEAHLELVADTEDGGVALEAIEGDDELGHVGLAEADDEGLQGDVFLRLLRLHVSVLKVHAVRPVAMVGFDHPVEPCSSLPPRLDRLPHGELLRARALLHAQRHPGEAEKAVD